MHGSTINQVHHITPFDKYHRTRPLGVYVSFDISIQIDFFHRMTSFSKESCFFSPKTTKFHNDQCRIHIETIRVTFFH